MLKLTPADNGSKTGLIPVTREFSKTISAIVLSIMLPQLSAAASAGEIIATLPPLAGLVRMLDPEAEVDCLLKAGSDPHHFQLSPRQVEKLRQAPLIVRSSMDDGGWLNFAPGTKTFDLWPEQDHAWLNPDLVSHLLPVLAEKLKATHPATSERIDSNLIRSLQTVSTIKSAISENLRNRKIRGVVMQHPSWRGLFKALGIEVRLVLESTHHGDELGPRHLEKALNLLRQEKGLLLVGDARHSNRSLEWLAKHSAHQILYLDPLGDCGSNWEMLMKQNIERMAKP